MAIDMNKIKVGVSGLTNEIYLYRMGKDKIMSLDKREASSEVYATIIEHMLMFDMNTPKIKKAQSMRYGDKCFRVTVETITIEEFESERIMDKLTEQEEQS